MRWAVILGEKLSQNQLTCAASEYASERVEESEGRSPLR